jgi:hypothetical protein
MGKLEGLVMMRSLALGGSRGDSYSKKFTQSVNFLIKNNCQAIVERHEPALNGFAGLHMQRRGG